MKVIKLLRPVSSFVALMFITGCGKSNSDLAEIIEYQESIIKKDKITTVQYLSLAKPFGLWDTRPQEKARVTILDSEGNSKAVPDFIWGYIGSSVYQMPRLELLKYSQQFFVTPASSNHIFISNLINSYGDFTGLVDLVNKSPSSIFVQQSMLRKHPHVRVNDVFREDDKYWKYSVAPGSPFPMSGKKQFMSLAGFSKEDEHILNRMAVLKVYCVVKENSSVILMIDGMLDSSYGYLWTGKAFAPGSLGPLYNLCFFQPVASNFYYYVSN